MYFLEAKIRNETGDFEIAANILEDIRKMPNSNLYPINIDLTLADVYISMKDYKKALNLVESYLIFHPYHVKSIKSKASIYYSDDSLPENVILQFCNQIEAINVGDDPELHYAVALLEYRLKRFDKVEKRLNSIILKKPSFIDYRFLLANIYFELNKEGELLKTLQVIKTLVTNLKLKRQVTRIIHNIEQSGIAKIKEKGQFNILLKY
jgi:tetratricopeptide (TPR) repeat protein